MSLTEIELRFLVPAASRAPLLAELARGAATFARQRLSAIYLDTADRRLARAAIGWRLRKEGRLWVQTLKAGSAGAMERFEHQVPRPGPVHDAAAHADTPVGQRLIALLDSARADGQDVGVRFRTEVLRTTRRVRTRGAVVEVAFDEGRIVGGDATLRIREVEFELLSGSAAALVALAERWRGRYGLVLEPRSKAERGDRLAEGTPFPPVRKASRPEYPREARLDEAASAVLAECIAHVTLNAIGVTEGDPASRVEHVHQLRIGIRRLRSALRGLRGWVPEPPPALVDALRVLFSQLGASRTNDVLESGVMQALARAGAPPLQAPAHDPGVDPSGVVHSAQAQQAMLALIHWRAALAEGGAPPAAETPAPAEFRRLLARRLRRWHRRIAADLKSFDALDETALHALRKRIKRQRYATEFFAPLLRARAVERYLRPLGAIQDRMGELNDLVVARQRFQAMLPANPAAWFALGWLAARIAEVRALARIELARLVKAAPPAPARVRTAKV